MPAASVSARRPNRRTSPLRRRSSSWSGRNDSAIAEQTAITSRRREYAMTFRVDSEVGQLRRAIIHRPGLELSRLTPDNIDELLFDDVMWAKKAREEHDAFAQALRDKGVEVHYYGQLLAETLGVPDGRAFVLDRLCTPENLGPSLIEPMRALFEQLDGKSLAEYLVGGVLKAELHPRGAHSLKWDMLRADDFVLTPLPNHLFQRDNSCW